MRPPVVWTAALLVGAAVAGGAALHLRRRAMSHDPTPPRHADPPASGTAGARREEAALPPYVPPGAGAATSRHVAGGGAGADVLARHEARLLAIDGVVGVGLGAAPGGGPAVRVYLRDAAAGARVPRTLDGLPVDPVVTGPIEAYPARPPR